jgi:uncharacterized protein (DUF302 family)
MNKLAHAISVDLNISVEDAVALVKHGLREEGFGIITEVNVGQTLKEKIDADFQEYVILGACDPSPTYPVLQKDAEAGLRLPCNVVVRGEGERSVVSILDPMVMAELSGAEGMEEAVRIARSKLEGMLVRLTDQYIE